MQQVKKSSSSKKFYFTIYNSIKQYNKLPLWYELNLKSKQALNYYVKTLKETGFIKKIGYGTWETIKEYDYLTLNKSKKIKLGNSQQLRPNEVRGHAFMFKIDLPNISNWNNRAKYLFKQNIPYKSVKYGQRIRFKGRKVHLYNKSIIIYDKESYICAMAKDTKSQAIYELLKLLNGLENLLNVSLKQNGKYKFRVCRGHYALIKNALARQYDRDNKRLYVFCSKGLWFIIDNSYNLHEAETVLLNEAVTDNEGMQKYFNEHKENEFKVTPNFILNGFNKLIEDREYYAENLKSHVQAIKTLEKAVKQLTNKVNELK